MHDTSVSLFCKIGICRIMEFKNEKGCSSDLQAKRTGCSTGATPVSDAFIGISIVRGLGREKTIRKEEKHLRFIIPVPLSTRLF